MHNRTVSSLLAYSGLLYYTNLHHESLSAVVPRFRLQSPMNAMGAFFSHLLGAALHPKFILFLPALIVHIPAYISATLAARFLATPALPETVALFKVIVGGLGVGLGYAGAMAALARTLFWLGNTQSSMLGGPIVSEQIAKWCLDSAGARGPWGRIRAFFGTAVLAYIASNVFATWHRALIRGEPPTNLRKFSTLTSIGNRQLIVNGVYETL
jgi:glycerol-3-phosphate O-acyltransferase / dihydroxyacetone phosphate acyltransferase